MVSEVNRVPGQTEYIVNTKSGDCQDIHLEGNSILIATGHMDYGVEPFLYPHETDCPACHRYHGCLSIRDVEGIDVTLDEVDILPDRIELRVLRRADFGSDRKLSDI